MYTYLDHLVNKGGYRIPGEAGDWSARMALETRLAVENLRWDPEAAKLLYTLVLSPGERYVCHTPLHQTTANQPQPHMRSPTTASTTTTTAAAAATPPPPTTTTCTAAGCPRGRQPSWCSAADIPLQGSVHVYICIYIYHQRLNMNHTSLLPCEH